MYQQSIKTETNGCFASMQRTFYPKHINYFGDGQGREQQIISNNGGLNKDVKRGMQHTGTHFTQYNNSNGKQTSSSPRKEPTTHYY